MNVTGHRYGRIALSWTSIYTCIIFPFKLMPCNIHLKWTMIQVIYLVKVFQTKCKANVGQFPQTEWPMRHGEVCEMSCPILGLIIWLFVFAAEVFTVIDVF